jgi:hypothetical protein
MPDRSSPSSPDRGRRSRTNARLPGRDPGGDVRAAVVLFSVCRDGGTIDHPGGAAVAAERQDVSQPRSHDSHDARRCPRSGHDGLRVGRFSPSSFDPGETDRRGKSQAAGGVGRLRQRRSTPGQASMQVACRRSRDSLRGVEPRRRSDGLDNHGLAQRRRGPGDEDRTVVRLQSAGRPGTPCPPTGKALSTIPCRPGRIDVASWLQVRRCPDRRPRAGGGKDLGFAAQSSNFHGRTEIGLHPAKGHRHVEGCRNPVR